MTKILFFTTFALIINGCSSFSKEECISKNWLEVGEYDAMSGVTRPKTEKYISQCSSHGVQIKSSDYIKAYERGLKEYCTADGGRHRGGKGMGTHPRCEEMSSDFKVAYYAALEKYEKEKARAEEKADLKSRLLFTHGSKECSADWDCERDGDCVGGSCSMTRKSCSFDSDCKVRGRCTSVGEHTSYGDFVEANVCSDF